MEFRKSGQSDGRRRRVVLDEVLAAATAEGQESEGETVRRGKATPRRYSEQALEINRPRITSVIPVRWYKVALTLLLLVTGVVAVEGLHVRVVLAHPGPLPAWQQAYDVTSRGSLASWYGSLLLLASAAVALIIFSVRKHRVDDYRGGYRLWGYVSAACGLGSIDATTGLHASLDHLLGTVLQFPPGIGRPGSWIAVCALLFSWGIIRFALEAGRSRLARLFLVLTLLTYSAAVGLLLGWGGAQDAWLQAVLQSTTQLAGHLCLFSAMLAYARYIHLDAQGQLGKPKRAKKKASAKAEVKEKPETKDKNTASGADGTAKPGKVLRVDPAHATPAPKSIPTIRANAETEEPADAEPAASSTISKAERKKLRK